MTTKPVRGETLTLKCSPGVAEFCAIQTSGIHVGKFEVHGLSDAAAREARVRVHSALSRLEGLKTRECRVRVTVSGANGSCPAADLAVAVRREFADQVRMTLVGGVADDEYLAGGEGQNLGDCAPP